MTLLDFTVVVRGVLPGVGWGEGIPDPQENLNLNDDRTNPRAEPGTVGV
jgi:hypothetical protein